MDISFSKLLFSYSLLKKERKKKEVPGKLGYFLCHWSLRAGTAQIKLILYTEC